MVNSRSLTYDFYITDCEDGVNLDICNFPTAHVLYIVSNYLPVRNINAHSKIVES